MCVGRHKGKNHEWKIGDMPIQETVRYKYLGDMITHDGKNAENIGAVFIPYVVETFGGEGGAPNVRYALGRSYQRFSK